MDMIVLRRFLGRVGRSLLMGESGRRSRRGRSEGRRSRRGRSEGRRSRRGRSEGRRSRKGRSQRVGVHEGAGAEGRKSRRNLSGRRWSAAKWMMLINSNPMLNRMEIRDVHGVRTESTYVCLLPYSPPPQYIPTMLSNPQSNPLSTLHPAYALD
jgi:hypothetical protein